MSKIYIKQYCKYNLILSILIFTGCAKRINTNIEKGRYLLYNQSVKGQKTFSYDELSAYIKQRPNTRILGLRLTLYNYYLGKKFYNPSKIEKSIEQTTAAYDEKIRKSKGDSLKQQKLERKKANKLKKLNTKLEKGNWFMRNLGSPPVFYDSSLANKSSKQLTLFYKSKGFFGAKISYKADTVSNNILLTYHVKETERYNFGKISYSAEDGTLKRLVNENYDEILLKEGNPFDEQVIIDERDRLEKLFKNDGYYDFTKKYISFELDSINEKVDIKIKIANAENGQLHKQYTVNEVLLNVDEDEVIVDSAYVNKEEYKNVKFYYFKERKYSPKILYGKLDITPGSRYDYTRSQYTQRNLNQLDVFRYVNIIYQKDSSYHGLTAKIITRSTSKFQLSDEIGFSVSQGLPGPFGSMTFLARNVFNGCETFDINMRGGIEGVASAANENKLYQSQEVSFSSGLTFARLFTIIDFNHLFINNNPRTKIQGSFNLIFRPEYRRSNSRLAMTYFLTKDIYNQFAFAIVDINFIRTPYIDDKFSKYLDTLRFNGNNLFRSFQTSIATNMNFAYTYNDFLIGINQPSTYFRVYAETGGTTLNFLSKQTITNIKEKLNFNSVYIYWKLYMDFRKYVPITKKSTFATRINLGVANPYAGDGVLPYEKYFFSGGSNSNRAWLPRRLGPGSYAEYNPDGTINYNFEQPGLVQIELNEEYRFKIIKFFDGALFIDAGNVWLLDDEKKKSFKADFISEIAVGAGYGFRFDFSFLIVRLDAGYKMWDPGQREFKERWVGHKVNFLDPGDIFNKALWNIAVGYPF